MRSALPHKTIVIDGGYFRGYKRDGFIKVFRHKKTASVRWDVGTIDHLHVQSMAFDDHCEAAGMRGHLIQWFEDHKHLFCTRANMFISNRWGSCRYIPNDLADELALIVKGFFEEAAIYSIDVQRNEDERCQ